MYNFMYLFLFHRIHANCSLSSLPFSKSPLPSFAPRSNSSFLLRACLPVISTKLGIRICNKLGILPYIKTGWGNPARRNMSHKQANLTVTLPLSLFKVQQKLKLQYHSMHAEDLGQGHAGSTISTKAILKVIKWLKHFS